MAQKPDDDLQRLATFYTLDCKKAHWQAHSCESDACRVVAKAWTCTWLRGSGCTLWGSAEYDSLWWGMDAASRLAVHPHVGTVRALSNLMESHTVLRSFYGSSFRASRCRESAPLRVQQGTDFPMCLIRASTAAQWSTSQEPDMIVRRSYTGRGPGRPAR